jgi:hypothetical protein
VKYLVFICFKIQSKHKQNKNEKVSDYWSNTHYNSVDVELQKTY